MIRRACSVGALIALAASPAAAWEFRARFIERVGTQDMVLPNNAIDASSGGPRNIRLQFGVFDDENGPAPIGGLVGWSEGSLVVGGPEANSDERRNNGRIAPFNAGNGELVVPPGDPGAPFTELRFVNAHLGAQSHIWVCDAQGNAPPMPQPIVRGRNVFVSVYAFSIDPAPGAVDYTVTASGDLLAASSWETVGTPVPPVCPPEPCGPIPCPEGFVVYAPVLTTPLDFVHTLTVIVPAPPAAGILALAALARVRPRRPRTSVRRIHI